MINVFLVLALLWDLFDFLKKYNLWPAFKTHTCNFSNIGQLIKISDDDMIITISDDMIIIINFSFPAWSTINS